MGGQRGSNGQIHAGQREGKSVQEVNKKQIYQNNEFYTIPYKQHNTNGDKERRK
jgi:hypothetical protein